MECGHLMEVQLYSKTVTIQSHDYFITRKKILNLYLSKALFGAEAVIYFVDYCCCCLVYYKQLLDEVFVISRIIKDEVSVIS